MRPREIAAIFVGGVAGALVARLVLKLFAARPDNGAVATLFTLTEPVRAPLAWLDAGQPRFGATLELSTLVIVMACGALLLGLRLLHQRTEE